MAHAIFEWAHHDINGAANHVASLMDRQSKTEALYKLFQGVSKDQGIEEIKPVMDRFSGQVDDKAYEMFLKKCSSRNPAVGIQYVPMIQDKSARMKWYKITLQKWLETDPVAANNWISNSSLSQESIRNINEYLKGQHDQTKAGQAK